MVAQFIGVRRNWFCFAEKRYHCTYIYFCLSIRLAVWLLTLACAPHTMRGIEHLLMVFSKLVVLLWSCLSRVSWPHTSTGYSASYATGAATAIRQKKAAMRICCWKR